MPSRFLYLEILGRLYWSLPSGSVVKNPPASGGDGSLIPGWEDTVDKEMTTRLPEKSHRQKSQAGYSPWGHKSVGYNLVTKQQTILHSSGIFVIMFPQNTIFCSMIPTFFDKS